MHFDFIGEQGKRRPGRNENTRHLIRKRATQAAALTKRKQGTIKRPNPLQLPPWIVNERAWDSSFADASPERQTEQPAVGLGRDPASLTVINNVQINNYHLRGCSIDLSRKITPLICTQDIPTLLSAPPVQAYLVGTLLSRFHLTTDHIRIGKLLKLADPEFLSQLSIKYGQSPTLDAAIESLVARIKEFLHAPAESQSPRLLYGRALGILQHALGATSKEQLNDIWFATPTLTLFELLDSSTHTPWILHVRGAARVLKHLGPRNIRTEAQKVLLATQTPIMIIEALATAEKCYLDEPEWQATLQNSICSGAPFHHRSELVITSLQLAAKIPNLFNAVTEAVFTSDTTQVRQLQQRMFHLKCTYSTWNGCWAESLNHVYIDAEIEEKRLFYRAMSYGHAAIVGRLLLALDISQFPDLEPLAYRNAQRAAEVAKLTDSIRLAYARLINSAIMTTSAQWQEECLFSKGPLINKAVFLDWARAMERPVEALRD